MIPLVDDPQVELLFGNPANLSCLDSSFSDDVINEITAFSTFLLKAQHSNAHSALGFWCRKSNILAMKSDFKSSAHSSPKGLIFHITPANVDTVYFYSLILSILCGNSNIVRISDRSGDEAYQLIDSLKLFLSQRPQSVLHALICIVSYPSSVEQLTRYFSELCDMRVIWGGDDAIAKINQQSPVTNQICFPDRFSIAVLHLESAAEIEDAAIRFTRDYVPFSQQACSSIKAVLWHKTSKSLQALFWQSLKDKVQHSDEAFSQTAQYNRLYNFQRLLLMHQFSVENTYKSVAGLICEAAPFDLAILADHKGDGLLLSFDMGNFDFTTHAKLQTVSCFGLTTSELEKLSSLALRITPLGSALAFNYLWDGENLLMAFSN